MRVRYTAHIAMVREAHMNTNTGNAGIDYGQFAGSNRNKETGIHYGVISQNSLSDWINDVVADGADYGEATCPNCGNPAIDNTNECVKCPEDGDGIGKDYHCHHCDADEGCDAACLWSYEVFGEEMLGWTYDKDGYKLQDCLTNDVFVIESPFYTYAQFCSPCVPGAGNLDSPAVVSSMTLGHGGYPKTYCLGHDWFEHNRAPYRVFRVVDDSEVLPVDESEASK